MAHKRDAIAALRRLDWDIVIAFPPCTYLTVTGNRWYNEERYGERAMERKRLREEAVAFFMAFANNPYPYVAIENPLGIMSTRYRKPDQVIQPWQFGEPFEKRTCLWLKNLPPLKPTNVVEVPSRKVFSSGKTMAQWYADCYGMSKEERARRRSKTFHGVALAMAEQWGDYVKEQFNK